MITNLRSLQLETEGLNLSNEFLELQLAKQGLTPDDDFKPCMAFDLALAWSLIQAFKNPSSWSQGDMSESWDLESLRKLISSYFNKYGLENPLAEVIVKPIIQDLSYLH